MDYTKKKRKYPPEEILSHNFFMKHTDLFYEFYKEKLNSLNYKPNIIHKTLKLMEDKNLLSSIITQNIDGFDKMAGSRNVLELHGSILRNYCLNCHKFYSMVTMFLNLVVFQSVSCGGIIKPDVVLYEEALDNKVLTEAIQEVSKADLLIVSGTSLQVYPASSLVTYFRGEHLVLLIKMKHLSKADLLIVGGNTLQVYPASSLVTYFRGEHLVLILIKMKHHTII